MLFADELVGLFVVGEHSPNRASFTASMPVLAVYSKRGRLSARSC